MININDDFFVLSQQSIKNSPNFSEMFFFKDFLLIGKIRPNKEKEKLEFNANGDFQGMVYAFVYGTYIQDNQRIWYY